MRPATHRRRAGLALTLAAAALLPPAGCTRRFYRSQADRQVEEVLTEKNVCPAWQIDQWHVYPDPLSRFADPTCDPDHPPKPHDDPCARDLSPNPQGPGKAGTGNFEGTGYIELLRLWDAQNRQDPDANAAPQPASTALPPATNTSSEEQKALRTQQPAFRLKLEQASELGIINAREFQDRREDLYFAALAVTLERFSFAAQFFATEQIVREYSGSARADRGNRWAFNGGFSV